MAISQNGWTVVPVAGTEVIRTGGRTFRVRAGDVTRVFEAFLRRYVVEVEAIDDGEVDDWSYAVRLVRDSDTDVSNHASGTAVDLDALDHARGARGTFTRAQLTALRRLLSDFPVLRWGGDYRSVVDEMHFEIIATPAVVAAFARGLTKTAEEDDLPYTREQLQEIIGSTPITNKYGGTYALRDVVAAMDLHINEGKDAAARAHEAAVSLPARLLNDELVQVQHPITGEAQEINVRSAIGRSASGVRDMAAAVSAGTVALPTAGATPESLAAAVAAAIPADLARLVVDELLSRLTPQ